MLSKSSFVRISLFLSIENTSRALIVGESLIFMLELKNIQSQRYHLEYLSESINEFQARIQKVW